MIKTAVTNSAKQEFLRGLHQPEDVYMMALYSKDANLDATATHYTSAGEIMTEGYEAGGKVLDGYSNVMDSGTAILNFHSPIWTGASISARGAIIYNASRDNRVLATYDFGELVTSTHGKFTATVPSPTAMTGLLCLD